MNSMNDIDLNIEEMDEGTLDQVLDDLIERELDAIYEGLDHEHSVTHITVH